MIKTWNTIILWGISHTRTQRGGWGGGGGGEGRWPVLILKIANSIGNKQLSSTTTPEKCWTPFGTKEYSFLWSHCKQIEDVEPTVDKFEDQKVDKAFFCQILSSPPPPLLRRKLLDPPMSVMFFSEFVDYNKGMSNMLGVSIYWTVEDFWNKTTSTCR